MTFSGRGCARRGHGVIGTHFAEMTPKFGFLVAFGGHSWPLLLELWGIPEQVMTLKVCILTPNFFIFGCFKGHPLPLILKPSATPVLRYLPAFSRWSTYSIFWAFILQKVGKCPFWLNFKCGPFLMISCKSPPICG